MYTKEDLKEKLNNNNRNVDIDTVTDYLRRWHIDPVYEDENQVEYYDELTIAKLNQGIILKEQDNSDEEIIRIINKTVANASNLPVSAKKTKIENQEPPKEEKLENITIDVTGQTLALLADSIAEKITKDLTRKININNNSQPNTYYDKLKKDNQTLASQVEKLLEDNKKLSENISVLLEERSKFKKLYGAFYIKQD
jgi:hypothetical protein